MGGVLAWRVGCLLLIAFVNFAPEVKGCEIPLVPMSDVVDAVHASYSMYGDGVEKGDRIHDTSYRVSAVHHGPYTAIVARGPGDKKIIAVKGTDSERQLKRISRDYSEHLKHSDSIVVHGIGGGESIRVLTEYLNAMMHLFIQIKDELQGGVVIGGHAIGGSATVTYTKTDIILTGHNIGGAVASLLALKMAEDGLWSNEKHSLITFGQPRVGDRNFARVHDRMISPDRKLRMVYDHDRMPHVPPFPEFQHFSREIYMEKHKSLFGKDKMFFRVCYPRTHPKGCSSANTLPNFSYSDNLKYKKEVLFRPDIRRFQDSYGNVHKNWRGAWEQSC